MIANLRLLELLNLENDAKSIETAEELFRIHVVKRKSRLRYWQQHHRSTSWYAEEVPVESLFLQLATDNQNENIPTDDDDDNELGPTQYLGTTTKFSELTLKQKRYRTKNITETLQSAAANNNLSMNQLLAYLLYRVNYHSKPGDIIIRTVQRLIDVAKSQEKQIPQTLLYKEKTGHDGAGTMPVYHSPKNSQRESNIFSKLFTPLSLTAMLTGNVIWKNEAPNSSKTTRPLALIAEKETADLLSFVNTTFEPEENQLQKDGIQFEYDGVKYNVLVEIHRSMKDFKIRQLESGLHGSHCLLCYSTPSGWKDIHKIESGFPIERTASDTIELYNEMPDEYGDVERRRNDYATRKGLTSKPLSQDDHHYITIIHKYINLTNWILKIMYHFHANVLKWTETGKTTQK
ncbi:unnamed protein product [Didymodactylos carnosus]|uniref:V(D)J recombination-activating protein 1 RNase H domain-containing protein n=1 Tax=Didymodactylos carnosus TaxID=1234261 RepID=A0A814N6P0_9BILA|nr:unnamed protein product [Didymodactylos carnosus]CAF3854112.1 unnamed protein product [Didymodactylos carnosus]